LIPLKMGWLRLHTSKWKQNYVKQVQNLKKYNKLLSNSEFTKKDCSDVFNNIVNIGTGVSDYTYSFNKEHEKSVLSKFNIYKKYIYCQTSFDKNKGLSFLYKQYLKLPGNIRNDILLVFGSNIPTKYVKTNNINNKNVIVTGYLTEYDLHILHENAWLFVFPSTYEGFGIPPVEAMKHNKPVIVANNTSLVEVIGNKQFMFEHDETSCANLIKKLYNDENLYKECINNSIKRKNLFTWKSVSRKVVSLLKKKISICILVKNNEKWLIFINELFKEIEEKYKEVLDFEYFIYENNSTDDTKINVETFMNKRKGSYICEDINAKYNYSSDVSMDRGLHMNYIRNKAKTTFGKIQSDYTLLLDSDIVIGHSTIYEMVNYIQNNPSISGLSPFTACNSYPLHYYDSLAVISESGISEKETGNTCLFSNCNRCFYLRKLNNINISQKELFNPNSNEISVKSAFGCCFLTKTDYFNSCNYNEELFRKCNHVCEHVSFNKQLLKFGKIIIKPDIKCKMEMENILFG
jgi:hypothetical protein